MKYFKRPLKRIAVLVLGGWLTAAGAVEQPRSFYFDIDGQTLSQALRHYTRVSQQEILFTEDLVQAVKNVSLKGSYTAEAALTQLLKGTGLAVRRSSSGAITILKSTAALQKTTEWSENKSAVRLADILVDADELLSSDVYISSSTDAAVSKTKKTSTAVEEMIVEDTKIKPFSDANVDIPRSISDVQPYYIFDSKTIERSGALNIEEFLKTRLTMNTSAVSNSQLAPSTGSLTNNSGNTASSINLRGLGADKTLILVNGRRMAGIILQANTTELASRQADINGIPLAAIDRIEVLPTSASGIYGASALAGVVNIILKREYQGGEVRLNYENTTDTDAPIRRADASYGFSLNDGKTNVMLTGGWTDSKPLLFQDRADIVVRGLQRIAKASPGDIDNYLGATPTVQSFSTLTLDDGRRLSSPVTYVPEGASGTTLPVTLADNLYANSGRINPNFSPGTGMFGLQNQMGYNSRTNSFIASVNHQLFSWLQGFAEVSTQTNAGFAQSNPFSSTSTYVSRTWPLAINPFQETVYIYFPSSIHVPARNKSISQRATAGLEAKLAFGWIGQMDYTRSRSKYNSSVHVVDDTAMQNDTMSGVLNFFVDTMQYPLNLSKYMVMRNYNSSSTIDDIALRASGPVGSLPWGAPRVTLGLEHRKEGYPANTYETPWPLTPYRGVLNINYGQSQSVNALYLETSIPLITEVNMRPLIRSMEVQLANRSERYSVGTGTISAQMPLAPGNSSQIGYCCGTAGVRYGPRPADSLPDGTGGTPNFNGPEVTHMSNTSTIGFKYAPLRDIWLRASFAQAFVPPVYNQLLPNPALGQISANKLIDRQNPGYVYSSLQTVTGGNPELEPQRSRSWNLGLVYEPRGGFLRDVRFNAEFYQITQLGYITAPEAQQVISDPALADRVTRDSVTGLITRLNLTNINANRYETAGWDLSMNYQKSTAAGLFDLHLVGTIIKTEQRQLKKESPLLDYVGWPSEGGEAKSKANTTLTWSHRGWSLGWSSAWYGGYNQFGTAGGPYAIQYGVYSFYTNRQGAQTIPSQVYHQLFAGYSFAAQSSKTRVSSLMSGVFDNVVVQAGVKNLFNTKPPFDAYYGYYYSPYGDLRLRDYWLSIRKQF